MTFRDNATYVEHILSCIAEIESYRVIKNDLFSNSMARNAILRVLQVMAESTQRLSDDFKQEIPSIPWQDIADFRNVLVHEYLGNIDLEIIWEVVSIRMRELKNALKQHSA